MGGRNRSLKGEFFRSESLARCSIPARLTFAGLWSEADDYGRGIANVRLLKGALWALDDEITVVVVEDHLQQLAREHIVLYEVDGKRYYVVLNWQKHQAAAYRRGEAVHPAPPSDPRNAAECELQHLAHVGMQESAVSGREEEGKVEEEGESASADARPDPIAAEFEQIWAVYPKRDRQKESLKCFRARRKEKISFEILLLATQHYAARQSFPEAPFTMMGSTFFGPNERWRDFLDPSSSQPQRSSTPVPVSDRNRETIFRVVGDMTGSVTTVGQLERGTPA